MSGVLHGMLLAGTKLDDYSVYFDGSGDYLTIPAGTEFQFGTNDFTVEFWFNSTLTTNPSSYPGLIDFYGSTGCIFLNPTGVQYRSPISSFDLSGGSYSANVWKHVALCRSSSVTSLFVDGVKVSFANDSINYGTISTPPTVGCLKGPTQYFTGYISNLRVVKGTALYTANFTKPTSRLAAVTNTSLLTCQDSTLKDNSSYNFTITAYGNAAVNSLDPFS